MPDPVARLNAALEGRYRIERELGEGGMATVYLADDLKHERKVALKVLKPELAAVVGADRFLGEIKTTANLQHPHILALFDSGEADGFLFYVMPYVEGESLRERLDREKQLPIGDAVRIATAVSHALQHAHERGVIHRDIKPANILMQGGEPVVADFGIALAVGSAEGGRLTETGLSVGTPYYMSPEQAAGEGHLSAASDTYSLGSVLYEMLVGEPPYSGSSAQAILSKIITGELVEPARKRPLIPRNVDAVVRRALERLPADRFTSVGEFATALSDPGFRHGTDTAARITAERPWKALAALGWAAAFVAVAVAVWSSARTSARPVVRSQVPVSEAQAWPTGLAGVGLALSADGSTLVWLGERQLWSRRLDQMEVGAIPGTEWARNPVFSPDGAELAFTAQGGVHVGSLQGGPSTVVVGSGAPDTGGLDWGTDGMLYFADPQGRIQRVPATGGEPLSVATPEPGLLYAWPDALPEGRGLLFTIRAGAPDQSRIAVLDLESGVVKPLLAGATARYLRSGHVVYSKADSSLSAAPFDLRRLEVTGPPVVLPDRADVHPGSASQFAVSDMGTLVYVHGSAEFGVIPVRIDRSGNATDIDPDWTVFGAEEFTNLALSPDGDRVAFANVQGGFLDVWLKPTGIGAPRPVTRARGIDYRAIWSPGGDSLVFLSDRAGQFDVWTARPDGVGEPEQVLDAEASIDDIALSPDGQWLVYRTIVGTTGDIFGSRLDETRQVVPLVTSEFRESGPTISPDGRWLAYASDESGRDEIYVVAFPDPSASSRELISTDGGTEPVWAHNGTELFYRSGQDQLAVVVFDADEGFEVRDRRILFPIDRYVSGRGRAQYAVSGDDQSFWMYRPLDPESTSRLILVQNLVEDLGRLVPN
jgi:serine/threonine-protein kinase